MWLIASIGILVTLHPFLCVVLTPFTVLVTALFSEIEKLVMKLKPLLEFLGYVACYIIIVQGFRYKYIGIYIVFTGIIAFVVMYLHSASQRSFKFDKFIFFIIIALANIPMAIHFNSKLFGFASVIAMHAAIGFSVGCSILCYYIGFKNRYALQRSVVASLITIPLFSYINYAIHKHLQCMRFMQPFIQPVYIFSVYLLGLLIISSQYYYSGIEDEISYSNSQIIMILSLSAFTYIGCILNIESFFNVGTTFSILYLIEKTAELKFFRNFRIVLIFIMFVMMYFISIYLSSHPHSLISLLS